MNSQENLKIKKLCVVQDESNQTSVVLNLQFQIYKAQFNISVLLSKINRQVKTNFRVYDFSQNKYIEINQENQFLPLFYLGNPVSDVLLFKLGNKFKKNLSQRSSEYGFQQFEHESQNSSRKRERSKERVIFEVIEIIKKWREIHAGKESFKKVSLQEAAKRVGLPKKSLDDYYYQLRLGEQYGFDFKAHLNQRFGVLRSFLRTLKESGEIRSQDKHPKKSKIVEEFNELQEIYRTSISNMSEQSKSQIFPEEQDIKMQQQLGQADHQKIYHEFYNEFQFLLQEKDPFVNINYNFKRNRDENEQFLY